MKKLWILGVIVLVGVGIWYVTSGGEKTSDFGKGTGTSVVTIGEILKAPDTYVGQEVTVQGELTKECPTSGCWWYIKDATGEIRADSLGAGFALPLNQTGKTIVTTGKVLKSDTGDLVLAATGAKLK